MKTIFSKLNSEVVLFAAFFATVLLLFVSLVLNVYFIGLIF